MMRFDEGIFGGSFHRQSGDSGRAFVREESFINLFGKTSPVQWIHDELWKLLRGM